VKSLKKVAVIGLAFMLCGARAALADSLNIIVTTTGAAFYQFNGGAWSSSLAATQQTWDSMITKPGLVSSSGTAVGATNDFALGSMATGGSSPYYSLVNQASSGNAQYWLTNAAGSTEAGLILTLGGTGPTATVLDALVLDGSPNGIFVYQAPPSSGVTAGNGEYGYTGGTGGHGGTVTSFNPGSGTPITELGTTGNATGVDTGTGLEGDLEWNDGFLKGGNTTGIDNGANIGVGAEEAFMDPDTDQEVLGYIFSGADQPGEVEEEVRTYLGGGKYSYSYEDITPTIYFETGVAPSILPTDVSFVPTPSPLWSCVGLMGLMAVMKMIAARRQQTAI
jgi:hypothetical protein